MSRYELAGRTVFITGSTGGLGSALAVALRAHGANLALGDLDADATQAQAAALGGDRVAAGWPMDVRDIDSLTNAANEAADHFGRIDVVIALAGVGVLAPLERLDPEAWERIIDIDLSGVWLTFRATLDHVKQTRGHLLAISSLAAFFHSPLNGHYVAAKAGVWALCDTTRLEVRHLGVTVGSVHPTFFATPMTDEALTDPAGALIWGGNDSGLFKMVPKDTVVAATVRGIQRRSRTIVVPRASRIPAMAPGVFGPLLDRIGFRGSTIPDAIAAASPSGWAPRRLRSTDR